MPASMIAPVECPSLSPAPPSDTSAVASPVNGEDCVSAIDLEGSLSPSPWQEKRGEVEAARGSVGAAGRRHGGEGRPFCRGLSVLPACYAFGLDRTDPVLVKRELPLA